MIAETLFEFFTNVLLWIVIIGWYYFVLYRWTWDCLYHTIKRKTEFVTGLREYEFGSALGITFHVLTIISLIWYFEKMGGWISFV